MHDLLCNLSLGRLAVAHDGARGVFQRNGLDFCCEGEMTLGEACVQQRIDSATVVAELEQVMGEPPGVSWGEVPLPELVEHILDAFHATHREEFPRLVELAASVERTYAAEAGVPSGLAAQFRDLQAAMEAHMQKEEQVLFPLLLEGRGHMPAVRLGVERDEHRRMLAQVRALAHDLRPQGGAGHMLRALHYGLVALERDVMEHVHLENNVLFPRALRG